jgi:hypothetical protein
MTNVSSYPLVTIDYTWAISPFFLAGNPNESYETVTGRGADLICIAPEEYMRNSP